MPRKTPAQKKAEFASYVASVLGRLELQPNGTHFLLPNLGSVPMGTVLRSQPVLKQLKKTGILAVSLPNGEVANAGLHRDVLGSTETMGALVTRDDKIVPVNVQGTPVTCPYSLVGGDGWRRGSLQDFIGETRVRHP